MKLPIYLAASVTPLILSQPLAADPPPEPIVVECDNPNDQTADLQDAVDDAVSTGVYLVQLVECDYIVDEDSVFIRYPVTIRGRGRQASRLVSAVGGTYSKAPIVIENTTATVIEDVGFLGTAAAGVYNEGASGIYYVNAANNTLNRVQVTGFRIGVLYEGGTGDGIELELPTASLQEPRVEGAAPWSSFSNAIRDSEIVQNQTNILGMDRTNALNLFNVTFGGGYSYWGLRLVGSNVLMILGGDCEYIGDSLSPEGPEDGCVQPEDMVGDAPYVFGLDHEGAGI